VRVLLVNTKLAAKDKQPTSIKSLVDPRWKGRAALGNPLQGTTTVHLAELASHWGDDKTRAFLEGLRDNQVRRASSSWEVKQLVATGKVAFGLTNSDHAFDSLSSGAPVAVVYPDQEAKGLGALVLPTSVVLIRGGPHPENGKRLIDHLVSPAVEAALTKGGTYLALRPGAAAPAGMRAIEDIRAMTLDPAAASESLERIQPWIRSTFGL
jgi:iron(III) transport system substrate-binding protein